MTTIMATSEESLVKQYADIPFPDVDNRIILVLLNRSAAQLHSDRRYVVQVAVDVLVGTTKQVRLQCSSVNYELTSMSFLQDYLALVQDTFLELRNKPQDQISFLLPHFPEASTRLDFDESTTWYRLGDFMFGQFDKPPQILGVQCHALFKKPPRSLMGKQA